MARKKKSGARPNLPKETLKRARREAGGGDFVIAEQPEARSAKPAKKKKKAAAARQTAPVVKTMTEEDLAHEYAYVVSDLRNMGLLAGTLFAILVVLSFFL